MRLRAQPRAGAQAARGRARRGRRLRLQDLHLRRGDGLRLGVEEAERPPGEVDSRARRGVPGRRARPRPRHHRRDGARQGRQVPGHAGRHDRQSGRLPVHFATAVPTYLYGTLLAGQYKTPAIYAKVEGGVHQHRARRRLPRRRPAGGDLRRRAAGGTLAREMRMDPAELRRRNFIQPTSSPTRRRCPDLRQRRVRREPGQGAEDDRLAELQPAPRRGEARGKLRGIGFSAYIEACGIAPSKVVGSLGAGVGLWESGAGALQRHRHDLGPSPAPQPRPGPRDHLRPDRRRQVRRPLRQRRGRPRRHRPHPDGHGHLRLALARGRRLGDDARLRQGRGEGQEDRRAHAGSLGRRHRVRERQLPRRRHRPQKSIGEIAFAAYVPHDYPEDSSRAWTRRRSTTRQLHLPLRRAHLRGRDRSGHRRDGDRRGSRSTTSAG